MRIIQIKGDAVDQIEGKDAKIEWVRGIVEQLHGVMNKNGTSYLAVVEKKDGTIRLINAGEVAKLDEFIASTKDEYAHWAIYTLDTLQ